MKFMEETFVEVHVLGNYIKENILYSSNDFVLNVKLIESHLQLAFVDISSQ